MYLADIGAQFPVRFVNIYAFADASVDHARLSCTQALCSAVQQELQESPEVPTIWLGDFNICPTRIDALASRLEDGTLIDLGGLRCINGGVGPEGTCRAHNSRNASRRDFVLCPVSILHL
eukprot:15168767-Alexandrium_andersonii.AAC.1